MIWAVGGLGISKINRPTRGIRVQVVYVMRYSVLFLVKRLFFFFPSVRPYYNENRSYPRYAVFTWFANMKKERKKKSFYEPGQSTRSFPTKESQCRFYCSAVRGVCCCGTGRRIRRRSVALRSPESSARPPVRLQPLFAIELYTLTMRLSPRCRSPTRSRAKFQYFNTYSTKRGRTEQCSFERLLKKK